MRVVGTVYTSPEMAKMAVEIFAAIMQPEEPKSDHPELRQSGSRQRGFRRTATTLKKDETNSMGTKKNYSRQVGPPVLLQSYRCRAALC